MKTLFNDNWQFRYADSDVSTTVSLPHTPRIEDLLCDRPFTGIVFYTKTFFVDSSKKGLRLALYFGAAMHTATVKLNGVVITQHLGGYLPFIAELSKHLIYGADNTVEVELDNRETVNIPPGKPMKNLDFLYYGGLYRDVYLIETADVYITDAIEENDRYGGIVVTSKEVSDASAKVDFSVQVKNNLSTTAIGTLLCSLQKDGVEIDTVKQEIKLSAGGKNTYRAMFGVHKPHLWSPDYPFLYKLCITLVIDGETADDANVAFGIRSLVATEDGVFLNGKEFTPFGTNRHHQHPYLGIAASSQAERREARLLKDAGYNILRLAHYPQSEAFLDECARIGLFVIDCVPGWQFCKRGLFRKVLQQNVKDLVRRDRNNPAVFSYETSLNETPFYFPGASDRFFRKLIDLAKVESPSSLVSGDLLGRRRPSKMHFDIPYPLYYDNSAPKLGGAKKHFLVREYGDWGFGGNESTSRAKRGDGNRALQLQAWNYQWSHNINRLDKNFIGDIYWEGIDHIRGYFSAAPMSCSGVLDIFRLPKFAYYFFKSQKRIENGGEGVLFGAVTDIEKAKELIIYTNTDKVDVFADGELIGTYTPDSGETKRYVKGKTDTTDVAYWLNGGDFTKSTNKDCELAMHTIACFHDGGNCKGLASPPITIPELSVSKSLKLVGYVKDQVVATQVLNKPSKPHRLKIELADRHIPLLPDGVDFVYCYVHLLDVDGNPCFESDLSATLSVEGGNVIETMRPVEAGIAAFVLRANAQKITITAHVDGIADASQNYVLEK